VVFLYSELVKPCLSLGLPVFPQILKNLNDFPLTFSFADAVVCCYSGIKIILVTCSTFTQQAVFIGFGT